MNGIKLVQSDGNLQKKKEKPKSQSKSKPPKIQTNSNNKICRILRQIRYEEY